MESERYAKLVQFVKHRAKENLRAVIRYTADDFEILYLRRDLRSQTLKRALPRLHDRIVDSQ